MGIMMNGPKGSRICVPIIPGGIFRGGEDHQELHGTIEAPSSDWAIMHSDGSGMSLTVNFVFKHHDGDIILGFVNGRSDREKEDQSKSKIHSPISFETNSEKYKWMNNKILVGKGVKDGKQIKINYYELV